MAGHVYILTNQKHGTLYIGVSSDLSRRVHEHKTEIIRGFTSRYGCKRLVWYEDHFDIRDAIAREKALKKWPPREEDRADRKSEPRLAGTLSGHGLVAGRPPPLRPPAAKRG